MEFKKSTQYLERPVIETIKRIINVFIATVSSIYTFSILLALSNRAIVYILMPSAIGKWSVDVANVDLKSFTISTQILLTIPTLLQYPLFVVMTYYAYMYLFEKKVTFLEAIFTILKRIHIIIITAIIYFVSIAIGCILLLIPGLYVIGALSMALPSIAIDKKGIFSSLSFSKKLTKDSVMYTLSIIIVTLVIPNVITMFVGTTISYYVENIYINELVIIATISVCTCVFASAIVFLYNELKLRSTEKELVAAKLEESESNL